MRVVLFMLPMLLARGFVMAPGRARPYGRRRLEVSANRGNRGGRFDDAAAADSAPRPQKVDGADAALVASLSEARFVLAPLTRGGNQPFRELLVEHGCEATMGEMAFARQVSAMVPQRDDRARR